MSIGFYNVPDPTNEPILNYTPGSIERKEVQKMLTEMRAQEVDLPMIIGGKEVYTENKVRMFPPHDIHHTLGTYNQAIQNM